MRKCKKKWWYSWSWQNENKDIFGHFFKCSFNFRAHALQSEPYKVSVSNFVKFQLQSMSYKIGRALEKMTKNTFIKIRLKRILIRQVKGP